MPTPAPASQSGGDDGLPGYGVALIATAIVGSLIAAGGVMFYRRRKLQGEKPEATSLLAGEVGIDDTRKTWTEYKDTESGCSFWVDEEGRSSWSRPTGVITLGWEKQQPESGAEGVSATAVSPPGDVPPAVGENRAKPFAAPSPRTKKPSRAPQLAAQQPDSASGEEHPSDIAAAKREMEAEVRRQKLEREAAAGGNNDSGPDLTRKPDKRASARANE